jgi:hypothetical protein
VADLDAAIHERLGWHGGNKHADAIRAVLVVCDRLDLSIGEHRQAARLIREAIASALGVPQAGKPGTT